MTLVYDKNAEWLETDGLGGFASGTVSGIRTRRYHALLLVATNPPTGRFVLVNGFDAWIETSTEKYSISSQAYSPDVIAPDGESRIEEFIPDPWPKWKFKLDDRASVEQEIFVPHGIPAVALSWRIAGNARKAKLKVRPFFSGRDYHSMHHENSSFRFLAESKDGRLLWRPYDGLPDIVAVTNGQFIPEPLWYRNFLYEEERARGLDFNEDLPTPGVFEWDLSRSEAYLIFTADPNLAGDFEAIRSFERSRRKKLASNDLRSADAYLVKRGEGKTIVAGYPWFTDWGRDTFISLRGLSLATGQLDIARDILVSWAGTVSEGMLPNRFPDKGEAPEYNSVDASLWYIIAAYEFMEAMKQQQQKIAKDDQDLLRQAIQAILTGYSKGTRYGIHAENDGLLAAGVPGVQLTWMDAKIGDWVVTPRIGKPVEIQALWLNALWIAKKFSKEWEELYTKGQHSFSIRFWNEFGSYLYDVIDIDQDGNADSSFRPNQIFAIGGLPLAVLKGYQARSVVEAVENKLLTPLGLRSLAPDDRSYVGHYQGGVRERDGSYHQGTVWPWLIGPFVEAWVRIDSRKKGIKEVARKRFIEPLRRHLNEAGIGHISEIADGDQPFTPRGCPFQAWSLAELIRLERKVLA